MSKFQRTWLAGAAALCTLLGTVFTVSAQQISATPEAARRGVWARVSLLSPKNVPWQVQIVTVGPRKPGNLFIGQNAAATSAEAGAATTAQSSWVDLSSLIADGVPTARFLFSTQAAAGAKFVAMKGVEARFDIATAAQDDAIVRSITEHDPGNVISLRVPADLVKNSKALVSIREDTQRRLDEIKALKLPTGPLPQKLWVMTGFRAAGVFYTDPTILAMDLDIIKLMGMNGFVGGTNQQSGGQPGEQRALSRERGLDYSTIYLRSVNALPTDPALDNVVRLDWSKLDESLDRNIRRLMDTQRTTHPNGMPRVLADLADEPAGLQLDGPEYQAEFQAYLRAQGFTPEFFAKQKWEEVVSPRLNWRTVFAMRAAIKDSDLPSHRLFYWSLKFWNICNARLFAMATQKAEKYAPGVNTRANTGPPWWYDYGTLPRGTDIFAFGRYHSTSMAFNEDWNGLGSARIPLESNLLLMDWSRSAARPARPLLGAFITSDANRTAVKLRAFGDLARECKVFYYFYYGPGYTFFDPYSDKFPMVQGIAELNRDLGQVDDILWEGKAPPASVALLYSKSWPVWKEDDTEQVEQMMTYVSLLHAGVPVDFVSDEDVAEGRFAARNYKALYVVNESIPTAAATEIERWVRNGGRLWTAGWGGARDEYNSPSNTWNEMVGIQSRSWKPTGDLKRLGEELRSVDWQRPVFGREVTAQSTPAAGANYLEGAAVGGNRAYARQHGKGIVQVVPWTAGKEYMDAAQNVKGPLSQAVVYPQGGKRDIIAGFALASGAEPPAVTSVSQVLAYPLWTQHKGVVLLANYTGAPAMDMTVRFVSAVPVTKVRSLHRGNLQFTRPDPQHIEVKLSMDDVTDILVVE